MRLFENASLGRLTLPNRVIRSATFEGRCDCNGFPTSQYAGLYEHLAKQDIGAIITGFAFVSSDGRAMQLGQAGIDNDDKIPAFAAITKQVHKHNSRIFLQIAHAGRQTAPSATGGTVFSPGVKKSPYFNAKPQRLTAGHIDTIIDNFGHAARRGREAGFDGVQLHAAHGYLIHEFLNPAINDRRDDFGINRATGIGTELLRRTITRIREFCGKDFPLLVKVSAGDEYGRGKRIAAFVNLVRFLDSHGVDGIEISWGTMDQALNIFRGTTIPVDLILRYNPRHGTQNPLKRFAWKCLALPVLKAMIKPFAPAYNLPYAILAKKHAKIPIICVGGFRTGQAIAHAIEQEKIDFVSLCRPFIREPSLVIKWRNDLNYSSTCISCNRCAIMCDSGQPTQCHART